MVTPESELSEDLSIEVVNRLEDRGFTLKVPSETPEYALEGAANAVFNDGHTLGYDAGKQPIRDDEGTLYIYDVQNYEAPPGTASQLIRKGLEEAKVRGFTRGRLSIFNPKIISILEKLHSEGLIKERYYFTREWAENIPQRTSELLESAVESTPEVAQEFLSKFEASDKGFVQDAVVDGIIDF
jgi:hypothetical protein